MASSSGGNPYNRSGSSARSSTTNPLEHLQTMQSGIQTDWDHFPPSQPSWTITRNDSTKGHYDGSAMNVPLKKKLNRGVGLCDSRRPDVWRAVAVEFVATTGLTFLIIAVHLQESTESVAIFSFLQALVYSFAILAAAPISGGHLNPAITFTTFLTGQATLVRSVLYVIAQISGSILGAVAVMSLTTSEARHNFALGGCLLQNLPTVNGQIVSHGLSNKQGFLAEAVFTIIMLFVVYGIGFDTQSLIVTFPIISPFIIGGVFGILIFISQSFGYTAAMNPARCLGPAVIYRHNLLGPLYVFIVGPFIAALVVGIFLHLVHHPSGGEFGPILPLNFFQIVTPDHQRPGFGPRGAPVISPTVQDQDIAHSQHFPVTTSSVLELSQNETSFASNNKFSLVLQIKAIMQPNGSDSRRPSTANMVDVTRSDQNLLAHEHPSPVGCVDIPAPQSWNLEKER